MAGKTLSVVTATYGGALFDLLAPSPDEVDFGAIAEHLSKINRFNGATYAPYSVAQHCCVVADQLPPEIRVYGLLHDAHEAYIGDIPTPTARALTGDAEARIDALKAGLDLVIWRAAGIPAPTYDTLDQVAEADACALRSEARDLIPGANPLDFGPGPMLRRTIKPLAWDRAHADYLRALELSGINPRRLAA